MLHSAHALSTRYCYSIGNTPAVSLIEHQPPDRKATKLLLLGCGDVRNVLYTVFCNQSDTLTVKKLSFVCCDIEPAILARNIMLLSWLIDEKPLDEKAFAELWAAYYSVVVKVDCFQSIHERATLLVNISSTLSDWHQSVYGKVLRMTEPSTLTRVRQYWLKYAQFSNMSPAALDNMRDTFMKRFCGIPKEKRTGGNWSGIRSAGATGLVSHVMESAVEEFERFWKSGVVGGLPEFTEGATYLNPLFVYSNVGAAQCVIHYATSPILGFHCAAAFADIVPPSSLKSLGAYNHKSTLEQDVYRLARTAVLEFKIWCATFQSVARSTLLDPSLLTIYNHVGEAMKFCYTLQSALGKARTNDNIFHTCAAPWNTHVDFDVASNFIGPFDVIDTSNVADHVGLLNILTSALPLLKSAASSILYTENMNLSRLGTTESPPFELLKMLLCGEPTAIFALLRAAPMECLTGVSAACTFHHQFKLLASFNQKFNLRPNLYWRFSWKDILYIDQYVASRYHAPPVPSWDANTLSLTLAVIYNEMFTAEDFSSKIPMLKNPKSKVYLIPSNYTRASFVAFLKMIQRRYPLTEWSNVYDKFIELISVNLPFNLQSQGAQEVFLQMHIQQLHTGYVLSEALKSPDISVPDSWRGVFGKSPLPVAIPLLFRIPRAACQHIVKEFDPIQAVSDIVLNVVVDCPPISNTYASLHFTFANHVTGLPSAWSNSQDLIVYFFVPAWTILMRSRKATTISLNIAPNQVTIPQFFFLLGPELKVFETSIWNTEYVVPTYTEQFPVVVHGKLPLSIASPISSPGFRTTLPKVKMIDGGIPESTIRIDLNGNIKAKLSSGEKVDSFQESPCTFCVVLGTSKMEIILPFPSEYSTSRIRIARKSGWIEVITKFCTSTSASSFNLTTFPIFKDANSSYYSWNLPRLSTKLLPRLCLSAHNKIWINANLASTFSLYESKVRQEYIKDRFSGHSMVDFKETISALFRHSAGVVEDKETFELAPPRKVFFLDMEKAGVMSIIFVVGMRLTATGDTIVADSYVLPLNPVLVSVFRKELSILRNNEVVGLPCTEKSYESWTTYIKGSVERSRSWRHHSDCVGKSQDGMIDHLQQFLCPCGAGKVTKEFVENKEWKPFTPFVTHCLLTPIFSVSCMELRLPETPSQRGNLRSAGSGEGMDSVRSCFTCENKETSDGKLLTCTGCGKAMYCSKQCQKKDWKQHKFSCRSD